MTWRVCPVTVKGCWKLHLNLGAILLMGFCGVLAGSLGSVRKPKSISWVIWREKSIRSVGWWWGYLMRFGTGLSCNPQFGQANRRSKNLCCSSEVARKCRFHAALCRKPPYWIQHDTTMSTNWAGMFSVICFRRIVYSFLVQSFFLTIKTLLPLPVLDFLKLQNPLTVRFLRLPGCCWASLK